MEKALTRHVREPAELLKHAADLIERSIEQFSMSREANGLVVDVDLQDMEFTALQLRSLAAYVQPSVDALY